MQVPILALAFAIYIVGIAIVLYLRPKLMFLPGGSWKEFGVGRGESHTVLPFWLFAIFWAFISYGVGLVIMSHFATLAINAFPESRHMGPQMQMAQVQAPQPQMSQQMQAPQPQMPQQMPQQMQVSQPQQVFQQQMPQIQQQMSSQAPAFMKPISSVMGINNNAPGYYVLQNSGPSNMPQYVYFGTEPPQMPR
jgi:hypothetical protein